MGILPQDFDVLCVGHACYDLIFSVEQHPKSDEKVFADDLMSCGGGPAANAAVAISRLGGLAAFSGYLGRDIYGDKHVQEFSEHNVDIHLLVRDSSPTPLSTILVKPDGKRALINFKGDTKPLPLNSIDFSSINPKVILLDGHEPYLSEKILLFARQLGIPTVLDAGSLHQGTEALWNKVDYLVASEKFAVQFSGSVETAITQLAKESAVVVITLGEKGLIWQRGNQVGSLAGFNVNAIDTTGAGDAFHGAFSLAVAQGKAWQKILEYSSIAGALCCTKIGARFGLPWKQEHEEFSSIR